MRKVFVVISVVIVMGTIGFFGVSKAATEKKLQVKKAVPQTIPIPPKNIPIPTFDPYLTLKQIATGHYHSCGIDNSNHLFCWGGNYYGELGDGTEEKRPSPVQIGDTTWKQISAGESYTCGIDNSDHLFCWGGNYQGRLGIGTNEDSASPVQIGNAKWKQISAGLTHTCGIDSTDHLFCWGNNEHGQLGIPFRIGNNTVWSRYIPTPVGDDTWKQIATGDGNTCGINGEAHLFCWGRNYRAYGDGTSPVQIGEAWEQISVKRRHFCGIDSPNHHLFCWGENSYGQLGDGTYVNRASPVQIGEATWKQISAGGWHTCGIDASDHLFCWGCNVLSAQVGDGTFEDRTSPVQIGEERWNQISAATHYHTCGIDISNHVFCWGDNSEGQVGDGTTQTRNIPTRVIRSSSQ